VHQKSYRQYETGYFFSCLLDFACMRNDMSIIAYLKTKEKISKSSFLCYYNNSGLANYKKQGMFDSGIAKVMLTSYFEKTIKNTQMRTAPAKDRCCYLTSNEECSLVHLCTVLDAMGYGVTQDDLHKFADELINQDVDEHQHVPISKHVTEGLLLHHKELVKVVSVASLDPKRACQATKETRDAMFFKLNAYIEILHTVGKLPWQKYSNIPANAVYNMDELGNNTTKHRNKIISKKTTTATGMANTTHTFMQTSEGDGQMPWHITVCLTTCTDGKFMADCCVWGVGQTVLLTIPSNPVDCHVDVSFLKDSTAILQKGFLKVCVDHFLSMPIKQRQKKKKQKQKSK